MYTRDHDMIAVIGTIRPVLEHFVTESEATVAYESFTGHAPGTIEIRLEDGFWFCGSFPEFTSHLLAKGCLAFSIIEGIAGEQPRYINSRLGGVPYGPLIQLTSEKETVLLGGFESKTNSTKTSSRAEHVWSGSWVGNIAEAKPTNMDLDSIVQRLIPALEHAAKYANATKRTHFASMFESGLQCLSAIDGSNIVAEKLLPLPSVFSLTARRVLAATAASHVWGGMGSWNDIWPADDIYDKVTAELYQATRAGLLAPLNSGLRR